MNTTTKTKVIVLGSGVIGLTVALVLSDKPNADRFDVLVAARDLPEDVHSQAFTSPWAGAIDNWAPERDDGRYAKWEARTREKWIEMESTGLVLSQIQSKIYSREAPSEALRKRYDYVHEVPSDSDLSRNFGIKYLSGCITNTIHPHHYLAALKAELEKRGVAFQRRYFASLDQACDLAGEGGVVVNASALGTRSLLGVEDTSVFPVRGQTIRVQAPDVHEFVVCSDRPYKRLVHASRSAPWPRKGANAIWETALHFVPALKDPSSVRVIEHGVGLRPAREGGPRVETQNYTWTSAREIEATSANSTMQSAQTTLVVHAYGFGGSGYQQSWGAAEEAVELLKQAL
ncbi:unnamed protein product [Peniophora sp. CBMAI 1063]|nr:unnamed protein product [Peniophora sp. CBMAI 1063]